MTVRDIPWTQPLNVTLQSGLHRRFASIYEALDFLEHEWPLKREPRYESAIASCRRALDNGTPAAVARETFISACLEAAFDVSNEPLLQEGDYRKPSTH
jgi:hypothetical protein